MNAAHKKMVVRVQKLIADARVLLDEISTEEQDTFDNMIESAQEGERGQSIEAVIAELEQAHSYCEEIDGFLEAALAA